MEVLPPMLISIVYYVLDVPRYVSISTESHSKTSGCFIEDIINQRRITMKIHFSNALSLVFFITYDVKCLYLSRTGALNRC